MQATSAGAAWTSSASGPTVVDAGDDEAVLLYGSGRSALEDADLTVAGDRDLAVRFERFVPGP